MIRVAKQRNRKSSVDLGAALMAAGPRVFGRPHALTSVDDALNARALSLAGLLALLSLPLLMLSSMLLDTPLAVPAAIATGYLALSERGRSALGALVPAALVVWMIAFLIGRDEMSNAAFAAALMAPLFAAAPAFARSLIAQDALREAGVAPRLNASREVERPPADNSDRGPAAPKQDALAMSAGAPVRSPARSRSRRPASDLGAAIGFALRRCQSKSFSRRLSVEAACNAGISVACDRQTLRLIVGRLLDLAHGETSATEICLAARKVRAIALLRLVVDAEGPAAGEGAQGGDAGVAALRQMVERIGGTVVVDRNEGRVAWTVRLDLASEMPRDART